MLISLANVSKSYAGAPALRGAELAIAPGEIHALMGENGAGKSTLIRILAGVVAPDSADIRIDGRPAAISTPGAAFRHGLRFIHQELNIVPALSVAENIHLGRAYPRRARLLIDWRGLNADAAAALARIGITHIDPRTPMAELGFADRMLARISAALLADAGHPARLYVMDEPTAALTRDESERLFRVLREVRRSGRSVLLVSHRLDEVLALADRVTVLRDGCTVAVRAIAETSHDEIVRLMIGRSIAGAFPPPVAPPADAVALRVGGLAAGPVARAGFSVRKGEVVGLAGLSGAGHAEILKALSGAIPHRGEIVLEDRPQRVSRPADAWRDGIAYVPGDRRSEGLVLSDSIADNIALPHLGRLGPGGALRARRRETRLATTRGADVRLKAAGPAQTCGELSGGNQQKVVFAKALAGNPRVLLLDEPTRGVDIGAKFDIYGVIRQMTARGMAVLMASSDLPELVGMCDRILVFRDGAIAAELSTRDLTEETLLNTIYGRAPGASATTSVREAGR